MREHSLFPEQNLPLSTIIERLKVWMMIPHLVSVLTCVQAVYCAQIGFEYTHVQLKEEREWARERIETQIVCDT